MKPYNFVFQKAIFPVAEIFSGTSIQTKLKFLMKSQYWTRKKIEQYQNMRLQELIKHAYENVPYYRRLFNKLRLHPSDIKTKRDLTKLPLLTKQIIKENSEDLRAKNYIHKSYETFTSGSTGTPMKFYQTKEDFSWIWAAHFRSWSWVGYSLGDKFVKISLNTRIKISKRIQDWMMRTYYIYALKMDNKTIRKYLDGIFKFKPKFIFGYSSSLGIIADYMKKNNIRYDAAAVITTGDNLLFTKKRLIQDVFSCKVYDNYGCGGEGLNISSQCSQGHYHVNDELLVMDNANGEIIVTSLNNYAIPLIRYTPDDMINPNKVNCKIQLSTIASVSGRSKDVVVTPNGNLVVHFFTVLFEYIKGIEQFKVIQKNKSGILIQIVKNKDFKDERRIIKEIKKAAGKKFNVILHYVPIIHQEHNGKIKIIENLQK